MSIIFFSFLFFFLLIAIWYQIYQSSISNTNELHSVVEFQVFQSNTNNNNNNNVRELRSLYVYIYIFEYEKIFQPDSIEYEKFLNRLFDL